MRRRWSKRLLATAAIIMAAVAGCYLSHRPSLSSALPDEWLASPDEYAQEIVSLTCEIYVETTESSGCPRDGYMVGVPWPNPPDVRLRNCESLGQQASEAGCVLSFVDYMDCSFTDIMEDCSVDVSEWRCYDQEQTLFSCI